MTQNLVDLANCIKKAGSYLLGPKQDNLFTVIDNYLVRKEGTEEFYMLRVVTLDSSLGKKSFADVQGTSYMFNEYSVLSFLKNDEGVIQTHALFKETICDETFTPNGSSKAIICKETTRLCLVLDCYVGHDFSPSYRNVTNMQRYVILNKTIKESEAIRIFYKVLQIVERLHKKNIVHRDLKLENIIYNNKTAMVKLTNFCFARRLSSETDLVVSRCGTPAYTAPEICRDINPYSCKPSDAWALGIVLYTMLFGQYPFYHTNRSELFQKIISGQFEIPLYFKVSEKTKALINGLIVVNPKQRWTVSRALKHTKSIIEEETSLMTDSNLQVVPVCPPRVLHESRKRLLLLSSSSTMNESDTPNKEVGLDSSQLTLTSSNHLRNFQWTTPEPVQRKYASYVATTIAEATRRGNLSIEKVLEELAKSRKEDTL